MGEFSKNIKAAINAVIKVLFIITKTLFAPRYMVFLYKLVALLAIVVFIYAYYYGFQTYRELHRSYVIGMLQTKECGFEYMEKESGVSHLHETLTNPEHPLHEKMQQTMNYFIYVLALLSIAVFAVTMYYLTNEEPSQPSFTEDAKRLSFINFIKLGVYFRYLLIPSIAAIGLLVYYNYKKTIYIPDFQKELQRYDENNPENQEIVDPALRDEKTKELDRGIDATVARQIQAPLLMILILGVIVAYYVPNIPISKKLFFAVFLILITSTLVLTGFTQFYGKLQLIFHSEYLRSVKQLNGSVNQMIHIPEFRQYYTQNAQRLEKYSEEPFYENQIERLKEEGKLHIYLKHHATRNDELAFMTELDRGKSSTGKKLTWSPVVYQIRASLNDIRQTDEKINALFRQMNTRLLMAFFIPVFILIYILFHKMYKNQPATAITVMFGILAILFFVVFFRNQMSLTRPEDPDQEIVVPKDSPNPRQTPISLSSSSSS